MQIVIDIPEENYTAIKKYNYCYETLDKLGKYIREGTPLPKGHGRLVDADAMVKILRESEYYQEKRGDFYGADVTSRVKNFIEDIDTVIEADKEVENEQSKSE